MDPESLGVYSKSLSDASEAFANLEEKIEQRTAQLSEVPAEELLAYGSSVNSVLSRICSAMMKAKNSDMFQEVVYTFIPEGVAAEPHEARELHTSLGKFLIIAGLGKSITEYVVGVAPKGKKQKDFGCAEPGRSSFPYPSIVALSHGPHPIRSVREVALLEESLETIISIADACGMALDHSDFELPSPPA